MCCNTGGIQFRIQRQPPVIAGNLADCQTGLWRETGDDFVAGQIDGKAQDVEAASDIGHGGGRKDPDFLERLGGHKTPVEGIKDLSGCLPMGQR